MKKIVMLVAALCFTTLTTAQPRENQWGLSLFGGLGLPSAPASFTDVYSAGFSFGGELMYNVGPQTTIGLRGSFHRFSVSDEGARSFRSFIPQQGGTYTSFSSEGGEQNQFVVTANVSHQFTPTESRTGVSVLFGTGLYLLSTSDFTARYTYVSPGMTSTGTATVSFKEASPYFGLNGGLGVAQWVSNTIAIVAEGRYNLIFTENESSSVITALAGVRFQFGGEE